MPTWADLHANLMALVPPHALHPVWHELLAYVGLERFRWDWIGSLDTTVHQEFARYPDAASFYRDSEVYLYFLLGFWLQGIKRPYFGTLFSALGCEQVSILDYGCGIGCDGLWLLDAGYDVSFADVPSRSLDFLRWRLARRGVQAHPVYELPHAQVPLHDVAWCIDVLEHLPPAQQTGLLDTLASVGGSVFCTLVDDKQADGGVHHAVDVAALTAYAQARWPTQWVDWYEQADGSQVRLLVYGPGVTSAPAPRHDLATKGR